MIYVQEKKSYRAFRVKISEITSSLWSLNGFEVGKLRISELKVGFLS